MVGYRHPTTRRTARPSIAHATAVRCRRLLARRPWLYWVIVSVVAVAIAASVHARMQGVDAARQRWGGVEPVVVAVADASPGEQVATRVVSMPSAVVPLAALDPSDAVLVARQHVTVGEIITSADVGNGDVGVLALVPHGWRVITVVEHPPSAASPGDPVELVSDGLVVAGEAIVVGHHDDATLIATPADVAPQVAVAASASTLTVLLMN